MTEKLEGSKVAREVTVRDLIGLVPDMTGERSAAEHVRWLREDGNSFDGFGVGRSLSREAVGLDESATALQHAFSSEDATRPTGEEK